MWQYVTATDVLLFIPLKPSGLYMYRTVVTICTAQWSLYVPHTDHYMYRTVVTVCTAHWSLYTVCLKSKCTDFPMDELEM
jgi:hypothetical protein